MPRLAQSNSLPLLQFEVALFSFVDAQPSETKQMKTYVKYVLKNLRMPDIHRFSCCSDGFRMGFGLALEGALPIINAT